MLIEGGGVSFSDFCYIYLSDSIQTFSAMIYPPFYDMMSTIHSSFSYPLCYILSDTLSHIQYFFSDPIH